MKIWQSLFVITACVTFLAGFTQAEDEASQDVAPEPAFYVPLKPPFVVNFGGKGRLKYIKAEISIRVNKSSAIQDIRAHAPGIRHDVVMILSAQTTETVSSYEGKDKIREDILLKVRERLAYETHLPEEQIVDIFFNTFIVQR